MQTEVILYGIVLAAATLVSPLPTRKQTKPTHHRSLLPKTSYMEQIRTKILLASFIIIIIFFFNQKEPLSIKFLDYGQMISVNQYCIALDHLHAAIKASILVCCELEWFCSMTICSPIQWLAQRTSWQSFSGQCLNTHHRSRSFASLVCW